MPTKDITERIAEVKKESPNTKFLRFRQGTNQLQIVDDTVTEGRFGMNYHVILNGEEGILTLKGKLERLILEKVFNSQRDMTVIRVGTGLDTRYSVV